MLWFFFFFFAEHKNLLHYLELILLEVKVLEIPLFLTTHISRYFWRSHGSLQVNNVICLSLYQRNVLEICWSKGLIGAVLVLLAACWKRNFDKWYNWNRGSKIVIWKARRELQYLCLFKWKMLLSLSKNSGHLPYQFCCLWYILYVSAYSISSASVCSCSYQFLCFSNFIRWFYSDADGMSSMIGLPSDRALVEDDECLRLFIFKNLLNLPLLMHHDIFFSLFLSPLIGVERKILKHAQFHINHLIGSHLRCPFNY